MALPENVSRALAAELRERREAAGLSRPELAELSGLRHTTTVARLEHHERRCSIPQLVGIGNAIGVPASVLLAAAEDRAARGDVPEPPGVGGAFGIG